MRIKNNISALNAQIALRINESKLTKDLEKLTSGYRINRSGDDAAGLAISEQMRSQIAGLTQGELNARDGIGLLRTGEGAMQEIHAMLIRMNGLVIRSANGVYTDEDHRELIQEEVDRISQEIDRIASATRFDYVNLFHDNQEMAKDSGLTAPGMTKDAATTAVTTSSIGTNSSTPINAPKVKIALGTGASSPQPDIALGTGASSPQPDIALGIGGASSDGSTAAQEIQDTNIDYTKLLGSNYPLQKAMGGFVAPETVNSNIAVTHSPSIDDPNKIRATASSLDAKSAGSASSAKESSIITFQIGPDAEHTISIPRFYLSKAALGLNNFDVSTQEKAKEAIDKVDDMINYVSQIRGTYGAVDNALEHAMNSMNVYKENLTAAESRIRDTDMAKELTERTKDQILAQAAQAMLAQANALPESTLSLLQ